MEIPRWEFRRMSRGEINIDPIEAEFFSTEALGSLSDALVREAIQNSLDASLPGEKVKVIIFFSSPSQYIDPLRNEKYLKGLEKHLRAKKSGLAQKLDLNKPMNFLTIEDFGTRGLEGDIREDEDRESTGIKNDFFYFWRNVGRAVEGTTARGRWGLGKTVFQAVSRINSFFGLTIRKSDSRRLLMGQSVLKIHWCDGIRYAPYGYYGIFDSDFCLPIERHEFIEEFCKDFSVLRKIEPGLSIVIPFPEEEITPDTVLRSVINQYFFPILGGDLSVVIVSGQSKQILNEMTISKFILETDWSDKRVLSRRLDLARWAIELPEINYERLKEPPSDQAPKWEGILFDRDQIDRLRKKFDEGERLALLVPIWVRKMEGSIQHSYFKIAIERDSELEKGEDFFIRDGVTITGVSSLRQRGVRAIVFVSDRPLAELLGDSENPAHTEWQERSPKFKGRYDKGPSCLRFVKNSPAQIIKILSRPAEGKDISLLRDLFYIDLPTEEEQRSKTEKEQKELGAGKSVQTLPEITGDQYLIIHKTNRGFRVSASPGAKRLPKEIVIEVAYDVREGNPFKKYKPYDFDLSKPPIRISFKGLQPTILRPNALRLVLEQPDFQLQITGFDPNRDLKIKTTTSLDSLL